MIICIIGYVVLLFLVLQKQKRKIFVWCEEKTGRQILLILFCANTIALGLFWLDRQEKDSGEIERNVYGGVWRVDRRTAAQADERLMRSRSDRH